jgi:hypothetical protein
MTPSPLQLRAIACPLLVAGATTALVFAAGLVSGHSLFRPQPPEALAPAASSPPAASCGLPAGIPFDSLDAADRSFALRRGLLCADLQAGRIPLDEYRTRLALLDVSHPPRAVAIDEVPATDVVWASTVRAFSSQYTDGDWSAARALGAPDVPAGGGDHPNAWAPEGPDDRVEFLEVGFDRPRRIDGVDVLETHNAGAVTRVELIADDGTRTVAYSAGPAALAPFRRHIALACTARPIAAVRVTLESAAVADWNEIDAIGVRPCTPRPAGAQ